VVGVCRRPTWRGLQPAGSALAELLGAQKYAETRLRTPEGTENGVSHVTWRRPSACRLGTSAEPRRDESRRRQTQVSAPRHRRVAARTIFRGSPQLWGRLQEFGVSAPQTRVSAPRLSVRPVTETRKIAHMTNCPPTTPPSQQPVSRPVARRPKSHPPAVELSVKLETVRFV
jgi:hypothetical protein